MIVSTLSSKVAITAGSWLRAGLASSLVVLSACGGGGEGSDLGAPPLSLIELDPVMPLVADDGSFLPSHPATVPRDGAARTRNGRYASARQAEDLQRALGASLLTADVACCGVDAVELALGLVFATQAAEHLPSTAPVLVRGADQRLAAVVANRLLDAGYPNVWLITR